MQAPTKRLGEMLVDAGLITPGQLQSAITHQKIAKGRLGSNLVALGFISEEILMDFLAQQTGTPRVDIRSVAPPMQLLRLIPQRMAEQFTMLPVSFKEPKSLVLAMSDPLDLNALDSARFASGMNVEPVVASHSALRQMIPQLYAKLDSSPNAPTVLEVGEGMLPDDGLPMPGFDLPLPVKIPLMPAPLQVPSAPQPASNWTPDPFFDAIANPAPDYSSMPTTHLSDPFGLFEGAPQAPQAPTRPGLQAAPPPGVVQSRTLETSLRRLDSYDSRVLVMGLIKFLQRRGVANEGELERFIGNLVESGEIKETPGGR
ncbi:MAG TPA: hypothetical protein VJ505_07290 [Holophagaceae bacterium]|nr:hypothetical protein [Geothrix sp.]HJW33155.1 hypothetical protein [Holophagaceae bacterium]